MLSAYSTTALGPGGMVGTFSGWRRHPVASDIVLAVAVLTVDLLALPYQTVPAPLWIGTGLLLSAPLSVRRRWPRTAAATVVVGAALWLVTHQEPTAFHFALVAGLVMIYTLLVREGLRPALVYGACLVVGLVVWSFWRAGPVGLLAALWLVVPYAIGSAVIAARAQGAAASVASPSRNGLPWPGRCTTSSPMP